MKKTLVLFLFGFLTQFTFAQKDPVVMTINNKPVTKSEFLQIYTKNNPNPSFDKDSLDRYMELFQVFKLKVAEAEALGYDTLPRLQKELDGYKKQLALPYLIDSVQNQSMVQEAYNRTATEVRCSHILVKLDPNASPKDTLAAYNRLLGLKARIEKGEDFASVAKSKLGSEDPSVVNNGGDLGYFTAFQMVYPFEEKAYNTPVGTVSEPFRTRFGYHILKVTDKRPARGTIKVAHLMISTGREATTETRQNAEKKINEIYDSLMAGSSWEKMVTAYSEDANSVKKGGELPAFGSGTSQRMVLEFEDAAFALKKAGEFSKPVKTQYGYHIIKLIEWTPVKSFDNMRRELQAKVNKDERSKITQDSFVQKLKTQYNYAYKGSKALVSMESQIDSTFFVGKWKASSVKSNKTLFVLDGKKYKQQDFAAYMEKNFRSVRKDAAPVVIKQLYQQWEKNQVLAYEEALLPAKYPAYKALVQEYHDGIILYEIMQDQVWNKAVKDTAGLRAFFMENRSKYAWTNRIDATVYECKDEFIAVQVYGMLVQSDTVNSKAVLEVINKDSELNLKVRMNKFEVAQTPYLQNRNFTPGLNPVYSMDGKWYVVKVAALLPPAPKEYTEAKGLATSDYQAFLEKKWLEALRLKHKIVINEDVLYQIGQ
ncbi:MAG: peptidylprolyl isomerase [Flavobacteriia bacterium]|nr:peptidylprolyl isomerase [Flavobacteriia bacterium]